MSSADELPEDFETFANTLVCPECGDRVDEAYWNDAHEMCAGCYWSDRQ